MAVSVYKEMTACKDWGFRDQITRSGLSVVSNIAEGMERKTNPDKVRFLVIAKGSVAELKAQSQVGVRIEYIEKEVAESWIMQTESISRMLQGLIHSLS